MEYGEENDDPGSAPGFGAIFMSNRKTMVECFRQKILALPPSYADFVKKVKRGMALFLFEFESRQLYGVYEAVSDGGMNISRSPFHFSGRNFPAQVQFTILWNCTPLCEKDFHEAIRENYFTTKKFNFGLSQVQVNHLMKLFASKIKPQRQLAIETRVTRSAGNDQRRISIRERLKGGDLEDDSPQIEMGEYSRGSPHTAIEGNDNMISVEDDRLNNGKGINFRRENYLTEQVCDPLCQRKRMYDDNVDTGFYDPNTPVPSYRTGDQKRVTLSFHPMAGVSEHSLNIYAGVGINSKSPLDCQGRTDYERTEFDSTNNQLFDGIDAGLNSHGAFGRCVHKRFGRVIRFGLDPSKIYDDSQHFDNASGKNKEVMDRAMGTQHIALGFDLESEKLQNSFDIGQTLYGERRFTSGSEGLNANGIGGTHISTIPYHPSEYGGLHNRKVGDNFISVSKIEYPNSLGRFSTSYLDSGSITPNGSQYVQTSNYHDLGVARTSAANCPTTYRQSPFTGFVSQGAGSDHRYYFGGGDFLNSSDKKSRDDELCDRFDTCGDFHFARCDLDRPYAVSQCPELRPPTPALDNSSQFTPSSTHGSAPFTDFKNFCPDGLSPLSSHGMESDTQRDEVLFPSITNSTGFDYHGEKYMTSEGLGQSKRTVSGLHLDPGGVHPDSQRQRRSVFSRMSQTQRSQTKEESEDDDAYLNASADEIMNMLTSHQNVRSVEHRKSNPVVRQRGRDERVRTDVQVSPESAKKGSATPKEDATSTGILACFDELPKETRGVGFKRRRKSLKNALAENTPKSIALENASVANAVSEGPVAENIPSYNVLQDASGCSLGLSKKDASGNAVSEGPLAENTPNYNVFQDASIGNAVSEGPMTENTSKSNVLENAFVVNAVSECHVAECNPKAIVLQDVSVVNVVSERPVAENTPETNVLQDASIVNAVSEGQVAENTTKTDVLQDASMGNAASEGPVAENTPKTSVLKDASIVSAVSEGPVAENTTKTDVLQDASMGNAASEGPVAENTPKTSVLKDASVVSAVSEGPVAENTPKPSVLEDAVKAVSEGPVAKNSPKTKALQVNAASVIPVRKPQKRRKLTRPNFASGTSVEAVGN